MSSEMRELLKKYEKRLANWTREHDQCATEWAYAHRRQCSDIVDDLRALLARTEAGAKCDHAWQPDSDVMNARYCPKCDVTQTIPKKTTHPQDASGDAERHELLRQVYGMAREGCESPMAGYRWCERIDELFHAGKPSEEYADYARDLPDAMQAKEAK